MQTIIRSLSVSALTLLFSAPSFSASSLSNAVSNPEPVCGFGEVRFDSSIPAGRISECAQTGKYEYSLGISPENRPINHSPWYAFKVSSVKPRNIKVYLHYGDHQHRYKPKFSYDGETWELLDERNVEVLLDGKLARLSLRVGPQPLLIAGQEIISNQDHEDWMNAMAEKPFVAKSRIGESAEGRPISKLESTGATAPGYIAIVGRQHPPEVTGAIGLVFFVETLWGDSDLARQFREKFNVLVIPNMNPDGVEHGHWRHNTGGLDLNRDWGPFTQPETRTVRDELLRFKQPDAGRLYLFLDFHSTARDVFYTQPEQLRTFPEKFTPLWLGAIAKRFPGYYVNRVPGHNPDKAVSKNYMYETFGIPAITYELGDHTDRALIEKIARGAAEEMMRQLLDAYQEQAATSSDIAGE